MLRQLGKQGLFDFVNSLDDEAIEALEDYFGERIVVEKLSYTTVENIVVPINDCNNTKAICERLCSIRGFNYFSCWRDASHLYISLWR